MFINTSIKYPNFTFNFFSLSGAVIRDYLLLFSLYSGFPITVTICVVIKCYMKDSFVQFYFTLSLIHILV